MPTSKHKKPTFDRYQAFIFNFTQDCLFFLFLLILLSIYRAAFLIHFQDLLLPSTAAKDIALTMWYGLRISLKTAGALFLPAFVLGTLLQQLYPRWHAQRMRFIWACICITGLSLLFQSRIPYYHEFNNAFGPFVFNTLHDDVWAIVQTSIQQYNAIWRVLGGLACAAVAIFCFKWWLRLAMPISRPLLVIQRKWVAVLCICVLLVPTAVFVRKGGSFTYNGSIYWKNAARMPQHLLNEAILDDIQALYKASRIYKQFTNSFKGLTPQTVKEAAARLMGEKEYNHDSLLPLLQHQAGGPKMDKPRHIFVIVAETYMLWPLLDKYNHLPIAQGLNLLRKNYDSIFIPHFLPASNGTMFGLTSVLLGMPEINLLTANRPSAQQPYETALSVQLRKQGYKTRFFYGGFPSWENVGLFMNNQQIDESFYYADFGGSGGVWGVEDKAFLQGVSQHITEEPSFNLILTSSNHSPLVVDMSQEPQIPNEEQMAQFIPDETADKALLIQRLQHFQYADHYLAQFVQDMSQKYPDSLFIITGDHADRWTMQSNPSLYERLSVPLLIVGKGLKQSMLPADAAGSHMDIPATVLELVLPKGTEYYSLGQSLLLGQNLALHAYYWENDAAIGELSSDTLELLPESSQPPSAQELKQIHQTAKDIQTVAAWRILHGLELSPQTH